MGQELLMPEYNAGDFYPTSHHSAPVNAHDHMRIYTHGKEDCQRGGHLGIALLSARTRLLRQRFFWSYIVGTQGLPLQRLCFSQGFHEQGAQRHTCWVTFAKVI